MHLFPNEKKVISDRILLWFLANHPSFLYSYSSREFDGTRTFSTTRIIPMVEFDLRPSSSDQPVTFHNRRSSETGKKPRSNRKLSRQDSGTKLPTGESQPQNSIKVHRDAKKRSSSHRHMRDTLHGDESQQPKPASVKALNEPALHRGSTVKSPTRASTKSCQNKQDQNDHVHPTTLTKQRSQHTRRRYHDDSASEGTIIFEPSSCPSSSSSRSNLHHSPDSKSAAVSTLDRFAAVREHKSSRTRTHKTEKSKTLESKQGQRSPRKSLSTSHREEALSKSNSRTADNDHDDDKENLQEVSLDVAQQENKIIRRDHDDEHVMQSRSVATRKMRSPMESPASLQESDGALPCREPRQQSPKKQRHSSISPSKVKGSREKRQGDLLNTVTSSSPVQDIASSMTSASPKDLTTPQSPRSKRKHSHNHTQRKHTQGREQKSTTNESIISKPTSAHEVNCKQGDRVSSRDPKESRKNGEASLLSNGQSMHQAEGEKGNNSKDTDPSLTVSSIVSKERAMVDVIETSKTEHGKVNKARVPNDDDDVMMGRRSCRQTAGKGAGPSKSFQEANTLSRKQLVSQEPNKSFQNDHKSRTSSRRGRLADEPQSRNNIIKHYDEENGDDGLSMRASGTCVDNQDKNDTRPDLVSAGKDAGQSMSFKSSGKHLVSKAPSKSCLNVHKSRTSSRSVRLVDEQPSHNHIMKHYEDEHGDDGLSMQASGTCVDSKDNNDTRPDLRICNLTYPNSGKGSFEKRSSSQNNKSPFLGMFQRMLSIPRTMQRRNQELKSRRMLLQASKSLSNRSTKLLSLRQFEDEDLLDDDDPSRRYRPAKAKSESVIGKDPWFYNASARNDPIASSMEMVFFVAENDDQQTKD